MTLSPLVAIHMAAALAALAIGPVALWARRAGRQRPRLHRAFGHAWVTLMLVAALSAAFIRDRSLPNVAGYTPIHLLVIVTLGGLVMSFRFLARGDIAGHRKTMQRLYVGACLVAGMFALLPSRFLGHLVLAEWLGLDTATRARAASMVWALITHTPAWVWTLLAALVVLGLVQARERRAGMARIAALPAGMSALSLWSTVSAFGASPQFGFVAATWLAAAAAAFVAVAPMAPPGGSRFDPATRTFTLPGSWAPMALILSLFALRYGVNVALALQPGLAADIAFTLPAAAAYGAFSGVFSGRAARVWGLARRPARGFGAVLNA